MQRPVAFGPYRLIERIGVGALGEVYLATRQPADGRWVALKRLMSSATGNAEAIAMLAAEAELSRALDHPAISKVIDSGQIEGIHFVAYEYVHGRDLHAIQSRIAKRHLPSSRRSSPELSPGHRDAPSTEPEAFALDVAVHVVLQLLEALAHAHDRKDARGKALELVHRDVSPTNLLISFDGEVKLLDFGIARTASRMFRTDTRQIKGTVGYMSPEQMRGEVVDRRSDIFSLGICFWELCTGRRLLDPSLSAEASARVLAGNVPPARSATSAGARISPELDQILQKSLAADRGERYARAQDFQEELYRRAAVERLLADAGRVSRYVRSLFPEAAAEEAARRQEFLDMAENKGGSDLDVFEGLAKKAARPTPGLTPPPRKSTLMGGLTPLPTTPDAGRPPPSMPSMPGAPVPNARASTTPGMGAGGLPLSNPPPLPPANGVVSSGSSGATGAALPPIASPPKSLPPPVPPAIGGGGERPVPALKSGTLAGVAPPSMLPTPSAPPPKAPPAPPAASAPAGGPVSVRPPSSMSLPAVSSPPLAASATPPTLVPTTRPSSTMSLPAISPPPMKTPSAPPPAGAATTTPMPASDAVPPGVPTSPSASNVSAASNVSSASKPPPALPPVSAPPKRNDSSSVVPAAGAGRTESSGSVAALAPLPPPSMPPPKPKAAVDMDWDDDEESTHVYDKADGDAPVPTKAKVGGAAALMASSGGAARAVSTGTPGVPSLPPSPPIPASLGAEPSPGRYDPTQVRPRAANLPLPPTSSSSVAAASSGGGRLGVALGGAALVVALVVAAVNLAPKKGAIKINVTARSGAPIGAVDVYIDGQKKCEAAPCVVSEIELGAKSIKVVSSGFLPAEASEFIEANKEKVITVQLDTGGAAGVGTGSTSPQAQAGGTQAGGPTASGATGTGLRIPGTDGEHNVHVFVDGTDRGTLPADLHDLPAGTHKLRFDGGPRYEKLERSVDVTAGQIKDVDVKLKVVKGQVTLDVVTKDVSITLVHRGKTTERKLLDPLLKSPPVRLDIDTSESWRLIATKKGFDDFTQDLTFEDGQAEKTLRIELFETGKPAPVAVGGPLPDRTVPDRTVPDRSPPDRTPPETAGPAVAAGTGTLNINSIPVSKVVLDGKPLGSTPKVGVSVPAGSHTVTFIHPDLGKESVTVVVKNGETKTAAVKFKQP